MNRLRCEANENANVARSIAASSSLELRIKNGPAKSRPVRWNTEEGQTLNSGRSPMICSANLRRFLKHGIHLLTTLLTASRAERIQNFSLRAYWRSCGPA
ncbi:hypothetical protein TNCT_422071 [Trichonephila clavata]|uniref:Uncharacterized protein n=1 Tax=Trichonephila clavata TaxID=2740835 RepID=A0A8X6LH86_TRICU|nr:hypothetical protein TNCT_422071 [Trichonephila clavata]